MYPVEPIGGGTPPSQIYGASSRQRCGNDGQRKRVAHMPTATTTKEDSRSKLVQNHPHDFTKKPFFCQKILQRRVVEHGVRQQLLDLGVLAFQAFQALGLGELEPAVLGFPVVEGRLADPVLTAESSRLHPGLVLPQNRDDLLFRMPLALHRLVLSSRPDSNSPWINSRGQRHVQSRSLAVRVANILLV